MSVDRHTPSQVSPTVRRLTVEQEMEGSIPPLGTNTRRKRICDRDPENSDHRRARPFDVAFSAWDGVAKFLFTGKVSF